MAGISIQVGYRDSRKGKCRIDGTWDLTAYPRSFIATDANHITSDRQDPPGGVFRISFDQDSDNSLPEVPLSDIVNKIQENKDITTDYKIDDCNNDDCDDCADEIRKVHIPDLVRAANLDPEIEDVLTRGGLNGIEIPHGQIVLATVATLVYAAPKIWHRFNNWKKAKRENDIVEHNDPDIKQDTESSCDSFRSESYTGPVLRIVNGNISHL